MKTLILAAGRGRRMGHLTVHCPKPMLRVHGRPLLEYLLRAVADGGLRDVAIAVGYLADQIVDYFGDGHELGLSITSRYVTATRPETVVLAEREYLAPDESLLCPTGDSVLSALQIRQMLDLFGSSQADAVVTVEPGGKSDLRVTVEETRVTGSSRNPADPRLAYNMVLRQSFLQALTPWSTGRVELGLAGVMPTLMHKTHVLVAQVGDLTNVNHQSDLLLLQIQLGRVQAK